jgi:hypothetical protein
MSQFNLCNNDIIIILVLFIVFCIFLYMTNTTSKNEHFENITSLVTSNEVKEKYKTSFKNFFELFEKHTSSLKEINNSYKDIINNLNKNSNIREELHRINSILDNLQTELSTAEEKLDLNLDIDKEFNKLLKNLKELFNTHNILFVLNEADHNKFTKWTEELVATKNSKATTATTKATKNSKNSKNSKTLTTNTKANCNKLSKATAGEIDETSIIKFFYYNLNNKLDVIEAKNIGQLNLIKINIDNIKSIINKLNFNEKFKTTLLIGEPTTITMSVITQKNKGVFDSYYDIINNMYNKDSVNIFNIIDKNITCENKEAIYDNYKLIINNQKLDAIIKSFTDLEGQFKYYVIDEIFIKKINTQNEHFIKTKAGLKLWQSFCEKLKKLNKPNKKNLILKKFNIDLIEKKTQYIKQLEDNIFNIQNEMNDKELQDYDINRIRTNEQATKQYKAIKKGIDNIKNRNKIKINLT